MGEMKYFGTEEEVIEFYNSLTNTTLKMRSGFIKSNPEGKQWGVQWTNAEES